MGDSRDASLARQQRAMPPPSGAVPPPAPDENGTAGHGSHSPASSDEEDLPQTAAAHATHLMRYKLLSNRFLDLRQETVSLKSQVTTRGRKQIELHAHMGQHMKAVQRNDNQLTARVEALDAENIELKQKSLQFSSEHEQIEERLQEGKTQLSETENRIQRLMDRLVTLLSNGAATDVVRAQFAQELEESVQLYERRLDTHKAQLLQARKDNRKAALHLSDEQRRTKRLHDHLCKKQSLLFNRHERSPPARSETPPQIIAAASDAAAGGSAASGSAPSLREAKSGEVEEPKLVLEQAAAPAPGPPQRPISPAPVASTQPRAPPEEAGSNGKEPSVPDSVVSEKRLMPPRSLVKVQQPAWPGSAAPQPPQAIAAPPAAPVARGYPAAEPEAGAGPQMEDVRPQTPPAARAKPAEVISAPSLPAPVQPSPVPTPSRERMKAMEERLCDVLDAMQFESLVVRLGNGLYQFGRSWRAHIRLGENQEVYASKDDTDYEPIRTFIAKISQQERSSAASPAAPAPLATPGTGNASARSAAAGAQELSPEVGGAAGGDAQAAGGEREQGEAPSLRASQDSLRSQTVPTDPASTAAAAARQMCAQMLDPSWTLPRFQQRSDSGVRVASPDSCGAPLLHVSPRLVNDARQVTPRRVLPGPTPLLGNAVVNSPIAGGAAVTAGISGPGSLVRDSRAWSPAPPLAMASTTTTRVLSPTKVHAGDDAAGHSVLSAADASSKEPPRSPPPNGRITSRLVDGRPPLANQAFIGDGRGGGDVAGGGVARPRLEKRPGVAPVAIPPNAPTVLRRSPARAASPDEGARSRVSLCQSASGGAASSVGGAPQWKWRQRAIGDERRWQQLWQW